MSESDPSYSHPGIYSSLFLMKCQIPEERRKRSLDTTRVASGYCISISNDGVNFTDEVSVLAFDPKCYVCNTSVFKCSKVVRAFDI